jgi:Amidohydrolase family
MPRGLGECAAKWKCNMRFHCQKMQATIFVSAPAALYSGAKYWDFGLGISMMLRTLVLIAVFLATGTASTSYFETFDGCIFNTLSESERLNFRASLDAYSMGSARELRLDKVVGSIGVGQRADLAIIDQDVFKLAENNPEDLDLAHVSKTYFDGKLVYDNKVAQDILHEAPSKLCE